ITGGSRQEFAATLAQLGELREHPGALILAANGGVLFDRVQYMVLPEAPGTRKRAPARMVALLLGTALMAISLRLEWNHTRQQEALAGISSAVPSMIAPLATIPPKTLHIPPVVLPKMLAAMPKVASVASTGLEPTVVSASELTPVRVSQPVYPPMALMRGMEGQVVIEFGLADDGSLRNVHVVQSEPAGIFDQAAIRAMQGWKYPAPTAGGTQRRYRQTMLFVLNAALSRNHASSGTRAGEEVHARADCQIPTGTHICRWPGDGAGFVDSRL